MKVRSRHQHRYTYVAAVLVVLSLVAGACSSDGEDNGGDGDGKGNEQGGTDGTRLRVALADFGAESFDPVDMSTASAWEILSPIFDHLVGQDSTGEIAPAVAESWEINDDNDEVTFAIREGMTFHNGEDLTAEDVRYSLLRWLDPEVGATVLPPFAGLLEDAESDIEVVDDYTLLVRTPLGPAERFVETVSLQQQHEAYVLPMDYIEENGIDHFRTNPVGSGPWQFLEHNAGDSLVYERVEEAHPFRDTPAFEELELILVPEEATRLAMLSSDEIDITPISPESVPEVEGYGCCRIGEAPGAIQVHLFFNGGWTDDAGPLADPRVREALSLAIDREQLVDEFLMGYGEPVPGRVPGEFFPGMAGIELDHWEGPVYDPERAQELLDEAGVSSLEIPIYAFDMSGAPFLSSLGEVFLGYWQPLGVTGEIRPTDLASFFELAEQDNLDERTIGTMTAFRRRIGFDGSQAANGYDPRETPGGSIIGPEGETLIDDVVGRIAEITAAEGDQRDQLVVDFMTEVSDLYIAPALFYGSALWGIGNRAGDWMPIEGVGQLGAVYETVQPSN